MDWKALGFSVAAVLIAIAIWYFLIGFGESTTSGP